MADQMTMLMWIGFANALLMGGIGGILLARVPLGFTIAAGVPLLVNVALGFAYACWEGWRHPFASATPTLTGSFAAACFLLPVIVIHALVPSLAGGAIGALAGLAGRRCLLPR